MSLLLNILKIDTIALLISVNSFYTLKNWTFLEYRSVNHIADNFWFKVFSKSPSFHLLLSDLTFIDKQTQPYQYPHSIWNYKFLLLLIKIHLTTHISLKLAKHIKLFLKGYNFQSHSKATDIITLVGYLSLDILSVRRMKNMFTETLLCQQSFI